jgi:hypothetical protein
VAGINGTDEPQTLPLPMPFVKGKQITLFADGEPWDISTLGQKPASIQCKPRGGFILVVR